MATITDCKHFYLSFAGYVFAIQFSGQNSKLEKKYLEELCVLYPNNQFKKTSKIDYLISTNSQNKQNKKTIYINALKSSAQIINSIIYLLENNSNNSLIFLHASAIATRKGACLFLGNSGAGKSTIVQLLRKFRPFADDSVIIKKVGLHYFVYQTPFVDKNRPAYLTKRGIKLDRIYCIQKSKKNAIHSINSIDKILSNLSTQLWLDKRNKKHKIAFLFELTKTIRFYNLSFTKEGDTLNNYFSSMM